MTHGNLKRRKTGCLEITNGIPEEEKNRREKMIKKGKGKEEKRNRKLTPKKKHSSKNQKKMNSTENSKTR